jgi:hypothetical protein
LGGVFLDLVEQVLSLNEVWDIANIYLCLVCWGNKAYKEFKWGISYGRVFPGIMDILGHWEPLGPVGLLKVAIEVEVLL